MQLQLSSLEQQFGSPLSLPKIDVVRSPSGDSSNWSLASVSYRNPTSSWESDQEEVQRDDGSIGRDASPLGEEVIIEVVDTTEEESSLSSASAAQSLGSQSPRQTSDTTTCENIRPSQPSSPRIYRVLSKRAQLSRLGFQYRYGCGPFPKNLITSFRFYSEAAELGCGDALAALAVAYIFGRGVKRSLDEARSMLRKALLKGSVDALEVRALCSMTGIFDGKRNYRSCLELLAVGVARNDPACLLWAGFCFEIGLGTRPDPYTAKEAYLAARQSSAMTNLMLQTLPGVSNSDDPWALMKTALFLLHSSEDPDHRQNAMDCLQQAALLGFADAQVYLAICLIQGKWLQKDNSTAIFWLQQKAQNVEPHPVAQRILQQLE